MSTQVASRPNMIKATNKTKKTKRKQQQRNRTVKKAVVLDDTFARTQRLLEQVYGVHS